MKIEQGEIISVLEFCKLLNEGSNNLVDIYKENNLENTIKRELNLKKGLRKYLTSNVVYFEEIE